MTAWTERATALLTGYRKLADATIATENVGGDLLAVTTTLGGYVLAVTDNGAGVYTIDGWSTGGDPVYWREDTRVTASVFYGVSALLAAINGNPGATSVDEAPRPSWADTHALTPEQIAALPTADDANRYIADGDRFAVQRRHPRVGWFTAYHVATESDAQAAVRRAIATDLDHAEYRRTHA